MTHHAQITMPESQRVPLKFLSDHNVEDIVVSRGLKEFISDHSSMFLSSRNAQVIFKP